MKLMYAQGTCAFAVHLLLEELGKKYETQLVKLHEKNSILEKINPKNYVPVLVLDNGEVLTEGIAILEYLCDSNARYDLLPEAGTIERARAMEWLVFLSSEFHKGFGPLFTRDKLGDYLTAVNSKLAVRLKIMDEHLEKHQYFMGDEMTVVDLYAGALLRIAEHVKVDFAPFPNLSRFRKTMEDLPLVKKVTEAEKNEQLAKAA